MNFLRMSSLEKTCVNQTYSRLRIIVQLSSGDANDHSWYQIVKECDKPTEVVEREARSCYPLRGFCRRCYISKASTSTVRELYCKVKSW